MQVKDLGAGSFGICKLAVDVDGEYVAVKLIPRGRRVTSFERTVYCSGPARQ
jgi:hypothetical protein